MHTYSFENLDVWQLSIDLSVEIYSTTASFPKSEQFALTSQIQRASSSISANLAEGSGRNTARDKAHFINIAYGSLMETKLPDNRITHNQITK